MTERPARALHRTQERLTIGPSSLNWDGTSLVIDLREVAVPWPSPVRGQVRVTPEATFDQAYPLDAKGLHRWQPIAPRSRVAVEMENPALQWCGEAYVDSNWGHEPLEDAFTDWHWSRANSGDTSCVFYDARLRDGGTRQIALRFENGGAELIASPPHVEMQRSRWGVHRATRSSAPAKIIQTLEDTPFYARSVISAEHDGKSLTGVHESLSLDRFRLPIVQAMLPFRMPRSSR